MFRMDRLIKGWVHPAAAAFQLLTRLPIPVRVDDYTDRIFRRSVLFYPLVGFVLGLPLMVTGWLLGLALPSLPAAAILLAVWAYGTGGLHLDGLMDTADGLFSYRSRERMLEIMKDSRVGAMGVLACVLTLIVKWSLLADLLEGRMGFMAAAILGAAVWSRAFMTAAIAFWPYARPEGSGMGGAYRSVKSRHVALALATAFVLATVGWLIALPIGLALLASALSGTVVTLIGVGLSRSMARKLGGLTGDTYGALCELLEVALLLAAVAGPRFIG